MNYENTALQDLNVRRAIASAIDKENFTKVLLDGNGSAAVGPYPSSFSFGDATVTDETFDLDAAKELLGRSRLDRYR